MGYFKNLEISILELVPYYGMTDFGIKKIAAEVQCTEDQVRSVLLNEFDSDPVEP